MEDLEIYHLAMKYANAEIEDSDLLTVYKQMTDEDKEKFRRYFLDQCVYRPQRNRDSKLWS